MKEKSISVIIPCYNGARFLTEAIESVLAQTYRKFEIIVVDDGSTDNSSEIAARYPHVQVIRQKNQGVAAARNTGLHFGSGEYLVFHDQDDRLLPDALEVGVKCLNNHPDCAFVFGLFRLLDIQGLPLAPPKGRKQQRIFKRKARKTIERNIETALYEENFSYRLLLSGKTLVPTSAAMFRGTVFDSVGDFNSSLVPMDDYDMYLRIASKFAVFCHNNVIVEYRVHLSNQSRNVAQALRACLRLMDSQFDIVKDKKDYEKIYRIGREKWRRFFGRNLPYEIVRNIRARKFVAAFRTTCVGLRYYPQGIFRFPLVLLLRLAQQYKSYRR